MQNCKVNILGSEWSIIFGDESEYPALKDMDGYSDSSTRKIVVDNMEKSKDDIDRKENIEAYRNQVLRHEVTHAFLESSGMSSCSAFFTGGWAANEEMVDWFAIQSPKIFKVFSELDIL